MALTCHHVVLPNISVHPRAMEWEIFGISPTDQTNFAMDMPSRLDHLETVAVLKEEINSLIQQLTGPSRRGYKIRKIFLCLWSA